MYWRSLHYVLAIVHKIPNTQRTIIEDDSVNSLWSESQVELLINFSVWYLTIRVGAQDFCCVIDDKGAALATHHL